MLVLMVRSRKAGSHWRNTANEAIEGAGQGWHQQDMSQGWRQQDYGQRWKRQGWQRQGWQREHARHEENLESSRYEWVRVGESWQQQHMDQGWQQRANRGRTNEDASRTNARSPVVHNDPQMLEMAANDSRTAASSADVVSENLPCPRASSEAISSRPIELCRSCCGKFDPPDVAYNCPHCRYGFHRKCFHKHLPCSHGLSAGTRVAALIGPPLALQPVCHCCQRNHAIWPCEFPGCERRCCTDCADVGPRRQILCPRHFRLDADDEQGLASAELASSTVQAPEERYQ